MATRTAAQRRAEMRAAHLEAVAACPTREVLGRLGDKWVALILRALGERPRRHSELARIVAGARQKMLTQTLRGLERDGLVARSVVATVPAQVTYALTPLGESLLPVVSVVTAWADRHVPQLHAARRAYDGAVSSTHSSRSPG